MIHTRPALLCLLFGHLASLVYAQGSAEDYERADRLRERIRGKVLNERLDVTWSAADQFVAFQQAMPNGEVQYWRIDCQTGERTVAFDAPRLAQRLNLKPEELNLASWELDPEGRHLTFVFEGQRRSCDLESYEIVAADDVDQRASNAVRTLQRIRPSGSNGPETSVKFVNRLDHTVLLFWIQANGRPAEYGSINAGESRDQHTFANHSWLVTHTNGEPLAAFQATAVMGEAVIDQNSPKPREFRRRRTDRSVEAQSPDGKYVAEIKDHNVVLRLLGNAEENATDHEVTLSDDGSAEDFYTNQIIWSPNSKYLVCVKTTKGQGRQIQMIESAPDDQLQPKLITIDYDKPGDAIPVPRPTLFDVTTGKRVQLDETSFANAWSINQIRWSEDGSHFTFLFNQRGHQVLRVIKVDAAAGAVQTLIDEASQTFVDYAHKVFYRHVGDNVIWMSERDGWNHLYRFDAKTGELRNQITQGNWVVRSVEEVDEQNQSIEFYASGVYADQDPYYLHYCRVNMDGTGFQILTDGDGTHEVEYSPEGKYLLDRYSRVDMAPVTELRTATHGRLIATLAKADATELKQELGRLPERFTAKARDGQTDIFGVIFRPSQFDSKQTYPVIEKIYAGPHGSHVPKAFSAYHGAQEMAELGFFVVQIDGMGTSDRSKAFHDVCWQNIGDAGFPDRRLWIQAAAEKYPQMDLQRIGIFGGSAGGQNALRALLAHGDFYHVAVADCGCHDNRTDKIWWNELWMGWPIENHYEEQSNVTQAHRLQGKLLLIVGEVDQNVDPASTMQVVDALIKADKDFDLLIMPGVGHGAAGTKYGTRRQRDFFVRHLLHREPRWIR
ncbi:MAG: prolyl oligopeptidase family serine peptidase [Planctomycetales bacterium]|nr:prolyl oligopeptidase family serine peptidase [Planctomycetales bacterium]